MLQRDAMLFQMAVERNRLSRERDPARRPPWAAAAESIRSCSIPIRSLPPRRHPGHARGQRTNRDPHRSLRQAGGPVPRAGHSADKLLSRTKTGGAVAKASASGYSDEQSGQRTISAESAPGGSETCRVQRGQEAIVDMNFLQSGDRDFSSLDPAQMRLSTFRRRPKPPKNQRITGPFRNLRSDPHGPAPESAASDGQRARRAGRWA